MQQCILIYLESDLCCASGSGGGNLVDSDVYQDPYGFPMIPAKRIKGCLREVAEDLCAISGEDDSRLRHVFGTIDSPGCLKIGDAELPEAEGMIRCNRFASSQLTANEILDYYTYLRTQTAIDETGTAARNSLRTIRVIKRGLTFYAPIWLDGDLDDIAWIKRCCAMLRHMGLHRTRGLGAIKVSLEERDFHGPSACMSSTTDEKAESYRLDYLVQLEQPLLMSSAQTNYSTGFLPGSSILGYCANQYVTEKRQKNTQYCPWEDPAFKQLFLSGETVFANACISDPSGIASVPSPLSLVELKDQKGTFLNKIFPLDTTAANVDQSHSESGSVRTESTRGTYLQKWDNCQRVLKPEVHISYHVAKNSDSQQLFQYFSLEQGQFFQGSIYGKKEPLELLQKLLSEKRTIHLGKSKNAQYGNLLMTHAKITPVKSEADRSYESFALVLETPAVFLNCMGMYCTSEKLVEQCIGRLINDQSIELRLTDYYLESTTASGYNMQWKMPKPQVPCFSAGSVFKFEVVGGTVALPPHLTIGEKRGEGYGRAYIVDCSKTNSASIQNGTTEQSIDTKNSSTIEQNKQVEIDEQYKAIVDFTAFHAGRNLLMKEAIESAQKKGGSTLNSTSIGRLLLWLRNSADYMEFVSLVEGIKDGKKKKVTLEVLFEKLEPMKFKQILLQNRIHSEVSAEQQDALMKAYFDAYLTELMRCVKGAKE